MIMATHKNSTTKLKKGTRITVSLTESDHVALEAIAERCNVSLSWLTRKAITEFLEVYDATGTQLPLALKAKEKLPHA